MVKLSPPAPSWRPTGAVLSAFLLVSNTSTSEHSSPGFCAFALQTCCFASFWFKCCQINSHRSHLTFESVFCWSCCCLLAAALCCLLTNLHLAGIPPLLNLALLFLLDSAVSCVEFGCCCCPTPLLVLFDLAVGFARSNCGFLVDSDPCSCWIGFLVCWTLIGPSFGQVLRLLWFLVCWSCSLVLLWWRSTQ